MAKRSAAMCIARHTCRRPTASSLGMPPGLHASSVGLAEPPVADQPSAGPLGWRVIADWKCQNVETSKRRNVKTWRVTWLRRSDVETA